MDKRADEEVRLDAENLRADVIRGFTDADREVRALLIQAHWMQRIFEALSAIEMDLRKGTRS